MKEIKDIVGPGFFLKTCYCDKHGEYQGYAFDLNGQIINPECPECVLEKNAKVEQARIEREQASRKSRLINDIKDNLISHGADLESVNVSEIFRDAVGREKALQRTKELIDGEISILLMIGLQGTGKTVLACNIAKEFALKQNSATSVKYIKESQIARNIKSSYSIKSSEAEVMRELSSVPLLIIDELTAETGDREMVQIEDIICDRFSKRLPTVLCGNLKKDDLGKKFSARVSSRLVGYGDVIELAGHDRRIKPLAMKSNLPAFRKIYTALKTDTTAQFVTDEQIKEDVMNAKAEDIVKLIIQVRDSLKTRS